MTLTSNSFNYFLFVVVIFCSVLGYLSPYTEFTSLQYFFAFVLSINVILQKMQGLRNLDKIWISWIFFAIFCFLVSRLIYQTNSLLVTTIIMNVAIGMWLSQYRGSHAFIKFIFSMVVIWIFFKYFATGVPTPLNGILILDGLIQGSVNHVSILVLGLFSVYAFLVLKNTDSTPFVGSVVVLIISFMTLGRSAIISSLFLVFWILFVKGNKKATVSIFIPLTFVYFIYIDNGVSNFLLQYLDRLVNSDLTQSSRLELIKHYFYDLDVVSILFGHDVFYSQEIANISSHNSFMSLHQGAGLAGLFLIISIFVCEIYLLFNLSLYGGILGAIIIRSFTDSGNFIGGFLMGSVSIAIIYVTIIGIISKRKKDG